MKRKKIFIPALIGLIICIAVISVEIFTPGVRWIFTPSGRVKSGLLDEVAEEEHISDVPDGEIRYLINNNVLFKHSGEKGNFMFENPQSCKYDLVFTVYENVGDGGEENVLYTSPVIKPGESLSGDKLDNRLKAGKYDCIYSVKAYSGDKYAGERSGEMTITVVNQSF